ncbi:non-specific lipid transfer protein GPI-anchored 7-like [Andrographis paniculata]|uniref:non-specific lipid transfer protein GPI-anchored 7-like n=1 Tax=Andrographis paniculata TaxID=175694 RepID=UPI0021E80D44|nr:non-specific lipid transfer protein GPI-anchored 7-like [Andrographis paniculata]
MAYNWWALALAVVTAAAAVAEGQNDCAAQLVPCAAYLNSSNPSAECCGAIRQVVSTQLPCLCNLVNHPELVPGVDLAQALKLPQHCNISSDTSACRSPAPDSSAGLPPPATRGGGDGNGGIRVSSWMGMPAAFLFILGVTFLY